MRCAYFFLLPRRFSNTVLFTKSVLKLCFPCILNSCTPNRCGPTYKGCVDSKTKRSCGMWARGISWILQSSVYKDFLLSDYENGHFFPFIEHLRYVFLERSHSHKSDIGRCCSLPPSPAKSKGNILYRNKERGEEGESKVLIFTFHWLAISYFC